SSGQLRRLRNLHQFALNSCDNTGSLEDFQPFVQRTSTCCPVHSQRTRSRKSSVSQERAGNQGDHERLISQQLDQAIAPSIGPHCEPPRPRQWPCAPPSSGCCPIRLGAAGIGGRSRAAEL